MSDSININNLEAAKGRRVSPPYEIPQKLLTTGLISHDEWRSLEDDYKEIILNEYIGNDWAEKLGLIKDNKPEYRADRLVEGSPAKFKEEVGFVAEVESLKKEFERVKNELSSEINQKSLPKEPAGMRLTEEERARIQVETGQIPNQPFAPKIFGYQASASLIRNASAVSNTGSVTSASTWLATLINKLLQLSN